MIAMKFWSIEYTTPAGDRDEVVIQTSKFCTEGDSVSLYRGHELIAHVNRVLVVQPTQPVVIDARSGEVPDELTP